MLSVLLLGATGYLGGSVLTDLEHAQIYDITCLLRPGREACMANRKTKILLGAHADLELIEGACTSTDIVINAATSDDLALTCAINRGLKLSRKAGRKGVLVHVSGTQLIESEPTGKLENVPRFDDLNTEQIQSIPDAALHRLIDLEVVRADLAGEIIASIVCPGVIFGRGTGPYKTISSPFPGIVRLALKHKRVIYSDDGSNIWCHVHVQDVSDLVMASLEHNILSAQPAGFESAENGEHQKFDLNCKLGAILHSRGLVFQPLPLSVPVNDGRAPSWANNTTSRCFANRARKELGWTPKCLLEETFEAEILDVLSSIESEVGPPEVAHVEGV